jgi:hypothetical protein
MNMSSMALSLLITIIVVETNPYIASYPIQRLLKQHCSTPLLHISRPTSPPCPQPIHQNLTRNPCNRLATTHQLLSPIHIVQNSPEENKTTKPQPTSSPPPQTTPPHTPPPTHSQPHNSPAPASQAQAPRPPTSDSRHKTSAHVQQRKPIPQASAHSHLFQLTLK